MIKPLIIDKREYSRIAGGQQSLVFFKNEDEVIADVLNISENGICFAIDKNLLHRSPNIGDEIAFQYIDDYTFGDIETNNILYSSAHIRHIHCEGDRHIIGCIVHSPDFSKYVSMKKVSNFVVRQKIIADSIFSCK